MVVLSYQAPKARASIEDLHVHAGWKGDETHFHQHHVQSFSKNRISTLAITNAVKGFPIFNHSTKKLQ
jgi:hypothetical protein